MHEHVVAEIVDPQANLLNQAEATSGILGNEDLSGVFRKGEWRMNEDILISLAIEQESRGRYRALLPDPNRRWRLLDKLNHTPPLDPRYTRWFSSFHKALDSITVDPDKQVFLLSSAKEIDGATMPFAVAIEKVRFHGWGTIIGISPTLALYYGEEGESGAVIEKTV